jgi:hypothetical protein
MAKYDLDRLKRWFSEARDLTAEARRRADQCFDYYDNKQLSSDYIKTLRKRRQPEIWVNRIAPAVNGILGVMEQGNTDPRAFPRNDDDNNASEVATDALRYSAENARWTRTKAALSKDYLIGGVGACIVEVDAKGDPSPKRIRWGEFFYDPHSRDNDFEDARFMGIAKWMYVDEIDKLYPEEVSEPVVDEATGEVITEAAITRPRVDIENIPTDNMVTDLEDKPGGGMSGWGDRKLRRALVVEMYCQEGGIWHRVVFYGGGVLEAGESPYTDEDGNPTNPIVAQAAHVDRDNARYGIVTAMIPVQDEVNMRRSKLLNLVNVRQLRQTELEAAVDANTARAEAARPDGVIPAGYDIVPTTDMAAGQAQLLTESKNELERFGPAPGVLGRQSAESSGRAQLVRQQAGLVELAPVLAGIEDMELRVYRQIWARIRQFWNEPKMIRVTDDVGAAKFLQVNEPVMGPPIMVAGPDGMPMEQPNVIGMKNRPSEMDMDIIIDATPDTANIQQEQFTELVKLAGIYGPQEVPFDDLLKASTLPKKRELIEAREARAKQQAEGQAPQAQMAEAMFKADLENKAADTEQKRATAFKNATSAETQQAETMLRAFQAGASLGQPAAGAQPGV